MIATAEVMIEKYTTAVQNIVQAEGLRDTDPTAAVAADTETLL